MPFVNESQNPFLNGISPATSESEQGDTNTVRYETTLVAADLAAGVVGSLGLLPARHVPIMCIVDADPLGAGQVSLGLLNAAGNDISTAADDGGGAWATGIAPSNTAVQVVSRPILRVNPTDTDRRITLRVTTAFSTPGRIAVTLIYRPAQ